MNNETKVQAKEAKVRQPWTAKRVGDLLLNNALLIIMAIAVIYIAIKNPNFIKPASLINILSQTAAYLPAALGIAGCIVLTGTDLSAGRVVGLTACISASLLQNAANLANKMWPEIGTLPIIVVILLAMLIGAAVGCFNGFFVAKFKLHPFIVTLGTQLILYTCLLLYVQMGNNKGMAISNLDPSYTNFVKGSLFKIGGVPIPNYVLFAIVLTAVMWFIWNKTTFGKNMFALGSNEEAARVSGVNVFAVTVGVFALAGAMYGFTGFIEGARIGSNTANTGLNYPIVQTAEEGGEYYLYRDIDGSSNKNGTVFLDWQCSSNFTSQNNLVYGHNMKTGRMFAPIVKYRDQSFYDAHPYMYLYTPNQLYKVNLFAGMVTPHDSAVYSYSLSSDYIKECIANSTFKSSVGTPTGNILTLSTCAYDFDNARYVVMGEMVPIDFPSSGN